MVGHYSATVNGFHDIEGAKMLKNVDLLPYTRSTATVQNGIYLKVISQNKEIKI